jgi:hypothetical protein
MCLFCVLIEVCDSLVMLGLSNFIRSVGYYVGGNMVFLDAGYFYHYEKTKKFGISNCKYRDRNLLLAEVRDCTFNGTRNTVVVCFTSLLSSLTAISSPHPFSFQSPTHNLPQLAAVFKHIYHPTATGDSA